jgi:hypothetical protein
MLVIYTHPCVLFSQHRLQQEEKGATMVPFVFFFATITVARGKPRPSCHLCGFVTMLVTIGGRGGAMMRSPPPPCVFLGSICCNKRKRGAAMLTLCFFSQHLLQQEKGGGHNGPPCVLFARFVIKERKRARV